MNEYEYQHKLNRMIAIKNTITILLMCGLIAYTGSLWWLLLILTYASSGKSD